jgi:hypothetical protein
MTTTGNVLQLIGVTALLCAALLIGPSAVSSLIRHKENVDSYFTPSQAQVDADQARNASNLCPDWNKASTFERWTKYRNISWCEKFPNVH